MQLTSAMLFVVDLAAMEAFYRDAAGFVPVEGTRLDDWIEFDTGEMRLALHAIPAHIGATASPAPREDASCKLILTIEDLAAARERLVAAGATILDRPWGGWDFGDPEGNVVGVTER